MKITEKDLISKRLRNLVRANTDYLGEIDFKNDKLSLENIGYDSIRFVELIISIEDEFGFEIKDEDLMGEKIALFKELEALVFMYMCEI